MKASSTLPALRGEISCLYVESPHKEPVMQNFDFFFVANAFSVLLAFCLGNSSVTGEFPAQRPVTRSFDILLFSALEQTYKQTVETQVIWDAIGVIITSL